MEAEEIIRRRDHEEAVRLYRLHYWTHYLLTVAFAGLLTFLLWPKMPESALWTGVVCGAISGVAFALAQMICARPFKRKTPFWAWRTHPDDKDPRKQLD